MRTEALLDQVESDIGIMLFDETARILAQRMHERIDVFDRTLHEHFHHEYGKLYLCRHVGRAHAAKQKRSAALAAPHQRRNTLAHPRVVRQAAKQGRLRIVDEQVTRRNARAVALTVGERIRRRRGDRHDLPSFAQNSVDIARKRIGALVIEIRNVLEHHERLALARIAERRNHDTVVEIAQETRTLPVDPEHVVETENRLGVLADERRLAEPLGSDDETRHRPVEHHFLDQARARMDAGQTQPLRSSSAARRMRYEIPHVQSLLDETRRQKRLPWIRPHESPGNFIVDNENGRELRHIHAGNEA